MGWGRGAVCLEGQHRSELLTRNHSDQVVPLPRHRKGMLITAESPSMAHSGCEAKVRPATGRSRDTAYPHTRRQTTSKKETK